MSCFGHATNNGCESTNGVIMKIRQLHPYTGLDALIKYFASKMMADADDVAKLVSNNKNLSTYAATMLDEQQQLAQKNCYRVIRNGNGVFTVSDPESKHQVSHKVQRHYGAGHVKCTPCDH